MCWQFFPIICLLNILSPENQPNDQKREDKKSISHGNQFLFVYLNWQQFETSLCKLWAYSWHAKFSTILLNYPHYAPFPSFFDYGKLYSCNYKSRKKGQAGMQWQLHSIDMKTVMFGMSLEYRAMWNTPLAPVYSVTLSFTRNTGAAKGGISQPN